MKYDKEYIQEVLEENFNNYADPDTYLHEWLKTELENCPESFDVFFYSAWDELSRAEKRERQDLILSILEAKS